MGSGSEGRGRKHLVPTVARIPLDQLTPAHVQEMISDTKYNHVVPELQQEAAQRTQAIFERQSPTSSEA
jgi:hypothetical protein